MNIATWVVRNGRWLAGHPALARGDTVHADWATFASRVAHLAGGMRDGLGCRPGDRIAIAMRNRCEYLEVLFGAWHAGLVVVPINAKLHPEEIAWILDHSGSSAVFTDETLGSALADMPERLDELNASVVAPGADWDALVTADAVALADRRPDDPAWLFYTSGTTGRPKGATLTHRNLLLMSLSYFADLDAVSPADAVLHAAPLSHGSGLYGLPHVARGATSVVPESGGVDPAEMAALLEAWRGVSFFAAPTIVRRLVDEPAVRDARIENVKAIIYGGAPMYLADLEEALAVFGPRLAQIYGQGESPMTITALGKADHQHSDEEGHRNRLASVGRARTDVEVLVVGADDVPLSAGESGEVVVRGDVVMSGYWRDPEATAEALRGGWLHTGDVGSFDEDGYLTLRDRSKDVIISGGSNIYPREVEEVLLRHPEVQEVSVVGAPHPQWGEEVVAFVVSADPAAPPPPDTLDTVCLEHIARFKRPRRYEFVRELPKNNYGKVLKRELRAALKDTTEC
ncbi:MAG TPA: AMP-binding protein [Acidimicrobiia bacterium]|nr:AMP-binding protein [Acidimicrobiia bacterium]